MGIFDHTNLDNLTCIKMLGENFENTYMKLTQTHDTFSLFMIEGESFSTGNFLERLRYMELSLEFMCRHYIEMIVK